MAVKDWNEYKDSVNLSVSLVSDCLSKVKNSKYFIPKPNNAMNANKLWKKKSTEAGFSLYMPKIDDFSFYDFDWLLDHKFKSQGLVPGTYWIEAIVRAC